MQRLYWPVVSIALLLVGCGGGSKTAPIPTPAITAPGSPMGLSATAGNASASVTFVSPTSNGGSPITGYTATSNPGGLMATGTSSPITLSGLTNGTAYTFTVIALNAAGASLPSAASNSVTPSVSPTASFVNTATGSTGSLSEIYNWNNFGSYNVAFDDWGPDPGTLTQWINGPTDWWITTTTTAEQNGITSYPNASRGWVYNGGLLQALSTSGYPSAPNWTTLSGMGIQVSALRKCHAKWRMTVPTTPNVNNTVSRWDALMDIYLDVAANPPSTAWPPQVDLQIMQMLMDSPLGYQSANQSGYYAYVMVNHYAWTKTIGGVTYLGAIDLPGAGGVFNQPGGHTITMMVGPTMATNPGTTGLLWGKSSVVHDVGAILAWLGQANPTDDGGNPIKDATGKVVASPLIASSLYLSAINAGFELDFGHAPGNNQWATTDFWVAMQDEPDGP